MLFDLGHVMVKNVQIFNGQVHCMGKNQTSRLVAAAAGIVKEATLVVEIVVLTTIIVVNTFLPGRYNSVSSGFCSLGSVSRKAT